MRRLAFTLLGAAALSGCSHDYTVNFRYLSEAPPEILVSAERVVLVEGLAVGVEAVPIRNDRETKHEVSFAPAHPGIIGMDPGREPRTWVFYGQAAGATRVDVLFNQRVVFELDAEVMAP